MLLKCTLVHCGPLVHYSYTVNISRFDISSTWSGCGAISLKPDGSLCQCLL